MISLHIEHFGPIKDSTKIELSSLTVIIGRQSTGKSTFMKVLCFCRWVEKQIMMFSDDMITQYTHYGQFVKELKQFHRLDDGYFSSQTCISYEGETVCIAFRGSNTNPKITRKDNFTNDRFNTKLCYIPSERNLVSAIQNVDRAYKATEKDVLFNFIYEWDEAKRPYTDDNPFQLSVTGGFSYLNRQGADFVLRDGGEGISAYYASSGIQSAMPLEVMANYIINLVGQKAALSMTDRNAINKLDDNLAKRRLEYQSAQLFIEEPEQNLYPESQRLLLLSLVKTLKRAIVNGSEKSMIVLTTHSPYILSVVNVLLSAATVDKDQDVVDVDNIIPASEISGYFIGEEGVFHSIVDDEISMLSGNELDGVSDWVDDCIARLNSIKFANS